MAADVDLLKSGGTLDYLYADDPKLHFEGVTADRALKDGDTVELGGVKLTAHHTPGPHPRLHDVDHDGRRSRPRLCSRNRRQHVGESGHAPRQRSVISRHCRRLPAFAEHARIVAARHLPRAAHELLRLRTQTRACGDRRRRARSSIRTAIGNASRRAKRRSKTLLPAKRIRLPAPFGQVVRFCGANVRMNAPSMAADGSVKFSSSFAMTWAKPGTVRCGRSETLASAHCNTPS